ncbi:FadR/GntR family transcriptional regulator [Cuneatibacter caecimuris]|uniref:DNA-binding FadR family transcriptional regulator n=1 Tax=Cuneatibacter caecimuris TaxID=1796618 RepID=A0A4Q7PIL1_9FIRM|nr:FadR/GntR family transcriptional regulator [Cuneatibacter caecimuris]RZT00464.1 DNA-binding FadR family transcriptional regulator [Cuneatibacter caecimuris]
MKLQAVRNTPKILPEQAAEQIADRIVAGSFAAGQQLPNEFDLAEQLGVGRGTVREAVKILVSRNILEIRRGCGTFVCSHPGRVEDPLGFSFVRDKKKLALDLCEVRMMLEPEIAALAAARATDQEIESLRKAAEEVEQELLAGRDHGGKDMELHRLLAVCSRNQVVEQLIPMIQRTISIFITLTDAQLVEETIRTHRRLIEAVKNRDADGARDAMREHLENNRQRIRIMPDHAENQERQEKR